mmetsp:Transcript_6603/g.13365  ORF Transcript_6603/g.13365 Transcript_6603/m.13365 type:complete len:222 (-) Transcript_6603:1417-2082(-)
MERGHSLEESMRGMIEQSLETIPRFLDEGIREPACPSPLRPISIIVRILSNETSSIGSIRSARILVSMPIGLITLADFPVSLSKDMLKQPTPSSQLEKCGMVWNTTEATCVPTKSVIASGFATGSIAQARRQWRLISRQREYSCRLAEHLNTGDSRMVREIQRVYLAFGQKSLSLSLTITIQGLLRRIGRFQTIRSCKDMHTSYSILESPACFTITSSIGS